MKFVSTFLTVVPLPEKVVPEVVSTFAHRYKSELIQNHSIGPAVVGLIEGASPDPLVGELQSHNHFVLDALLASTERRSRVLKAMLKYWDLSTKDQLLLVNRPLGMRVASRIARDERFCAQAREAAYLSARHTDTDPRPFADATCELTTPVLVPRTMRHAIKLPKVPDPVEDLLGHKVWFFTTTDPMSRAMLVKMAPAITELLGDGTGPYGARPWLLFLSLCDNDPQIPLKSIIATACVLARAETEG